MSDKTLCLLHHEKRTVEKFLCDYFNWSKNYYKQQNFPARWSQDSVEQHLELSLPVHCLNHGMIQSATDEFAEKVTVLDENELIVSLNKQENIHSHPLHYNEVNNVLSILRCQGRNDLLKINAAKYDRGLLYRLDFETSGLMLTAKNDEVYQHIRKNFDKVMQKKTYRAKCHGDLGVTSATWKHWAKAEGVKGAKIKCENHSSEGAVMVELSWKKINYNAQTNISEVEIQLLTGFRHQIRTQFAFSGHPLVGDTLYGAAAAQRLYLHAQSYHLDYFGQMMHFKAPLPATW